MVTIPVLPDRAGNLTIVPASISDQNRTKEEVQAEKERLQKQLDSLNQKLVLWDMSHDPSPNYPDGDNSTRSEFKYNCYYHPKGAFFQSIKSKLLIQAINFAHKAILKGYDMDAYIFDDPRLIAQNAHFRNYIAHNFKDCGGYKLEFMNKIVDIIMFLRKEDPYYCRLIDMIETMPRFGLTDAEKKNIGRQ